MNRRSAIALTASHLVVICAGLLLARQNSDSDSPASSESVIVDRKASPKSETAKADRPLREWRTHEYAKAWGAVLQAKLTTNERVNAQRKLLEKWGLVDLQAAIRAALDESWAADGQWYAGTSVNEATGPLLDALSEALSENPQASWDAIQGGDFGVAVGLLRRAWIDAVGVKDPLYLANKLREFSWRDREHAIQICGMAIWNQSNKLRSDQFLKILMSFPPEDVSAEQLFKYGSMPVTRSGDDARFKAKLLATDLTDTRAVRLNAMYYGRSLNSKSAEEIASAIQVIPAPARDEVLFTALRHGKPDLLRITAIADLLVGNEAWDKLGSPEVGAKLQSVSNSEDIAKIAAWAATLPVRKETEGLFDRGAERYLRDNPDTARDWIPQISQESWRDRAYARYSETALGNHNDPASSQWALDSISDPEVKAKATKWRQDWLKQTDGGTR